MRCFHGGFCIDPGNPGDCQVNQRCISFNNAEEKALFDAKPDKYLLAYDNTTIGFKNEVQVKFFLTDFPRWWEAQVYVVAIDGSKIEIRLSQIMQQFTQKKNGQTTAL